MKVLVYILCYNDETHTVAQQEYGFEPWARVLLIHSTPYMENVMFTEYFPNLEHEWRDADYVGTLSWKARTKIKFDMPAIIEELALLQPDVFALNPGKKQTLMKQPRIHPKFKELWIAVLNRFGVSKDIATSKQIVPFYCNYWLAKPEYLRAYMQFNQRVVHMLETDAELQNDLWSDAKYKTKLPKERVQQVFNRPYFTYHPFICERLCCFFFWYIGCFVHATSPHVSKV